MNIYRCTPLQGARVPILMMRSSSFLIVGEISRDLVSYIITASRFAWEILPIVTCWNRRVVLLMDKD